MKKILIFAGLNVLLIAIVVAGHGWGWFNLNKHVDSKAPCKVCEHHSAIDDIIVRQSRGQDDPNEAPSRPDCYAIERMWYDPSEPRKDIDVEHPLLGVSGWRGVWDNTEEHLNAVRGYTTRWYLWEKVFTDLFDAVNYLQSHTELRPLCGGKISVGEL